MKIHKKNTPVLQLFTPLFCSIGVLISGQAFANTPSVSLNADAKRGNIAESGRLGYVGGSTRVGVSIDKNLQGQVDINQVVSEDDTSATSVEGWFGYQLKDKNGSTKGAKGGGLKLNHLWADTENETVHKVFGAYDKDANDHAKVTAGYGQEQHDLFWSGHVSKGISEQQINSTGTATKAYDYGIGGEVGTFLEASLTRVRGALDYEWGTDHANSEDKPAQATLSAGVQHYFYDSPHSVTFDISASKKSGGTHYDESTTSNARLGYQYEFGKKGTFQSDRLIKRTRVEVPGTPAIAAISAIPAIPATAGKPAKYTKKAISKPYIKLIKTTMKLENETFFKLDKATLTASAKQNLLKIAAEIRRNRYSGAIRITGNTCGLGDAHYDQILSERRAKTVRKFLIRQGFNSSHLIARGLGKDHPKYRNDPTSGFKNRRVDIEYVTQHSVKKKMYKTEYKNVLISAATKGTKGTLGRAGRAGSAGTPARFIWQTEEIRTAPLWIKRALHNPIRHKRSVDTYQTQTMLPMGDEYTLTNREGILDVLSNDGKNLTLTRIVAAPARGTATIINNKIRYIVQTDYTGTDYFTYEVKNTQGKTYTAVVNITIPDGLNSAPIAVDDVLTTTRNTVLTHDIIANDKDPENDTLTLQSVSQPAFGTVIIKGNEIIYAPNSDAIGSDHFTYVVSDGEGNTDSATVNITITSSNENIALHALNDSFSTKRNTAKTYDVLQNDTHSEGDTLIISDTTHGTQGVVEHINGKIKYTPNKDYTGIDIFTYTISNGKGHINTATVTVTITAESANATPEAQNDTFTTAVNRPKSYDVIANDHDDNENDTLTITSLTEPAHGIVIIENNQIKYTPTKHYIGTDSFDYTLSDGNGGTDTATVTITIEAAENQSTEAENDAFETYKNQAKRYDVLNNDSSENDLTLTETTQPAHGTVTIDNNEITYTPEKDYTGTDSFNYTISDSEGHTDTARVRVTITADSGKPILSPNYAAIYGNLPVIIRVLDDDTDPDGDTLRLVGISSVPRHGTATLINNHVKYQATSGYIGSDQFDYEVTDDNGHTLSATVNIDIKQPNKAPKTVMDNVTLDSSQGTRTLAIDVLGNDTDEEGDTLTLTSVGDPKHGTTSVAQNRIMYTTESGFEGQDNFSYSITDNRGNTVTGYVNVTVKPHVGASDDYIYPATDATLTTNVIQNDSDAEGHALTVCSIITQPDKGNVTFAGNEITFVPHSGAIGSDTFDYKACDAQGQSDIATVYISIAGSENHEPILTDDSYSVNGNSTTRFDVLSNDADADADVLVLEAIATQPTHGQASINAGQVIYVANNNYSGLDTFMYTVTDGYGHYKNATVTVTLAAIENSAPVIRTIAPFTVNTEVESTLDLSAYISDADDDNVFIAAADALSGRLTFNGLIIKYTPIEAASGHTDTLNIEVRDGNGGATHATVSVNIN